MLLLSRCSAHGAVPIEHPPYGYLAALDLIASIDTLSRFELAANSPPTGPGLDLSGHAPQRRAAAAAATTAKTSISVVNRPTGHHPSRYTNRQMPLLEAVCASISIGTIPPQSCLTDHLNRPQPVCLASGPKTSLPLMLLVAPRPLPARYLPAPPPLVPHSLMHMGPHRTSSSTTLAYLSSSFT